MTVARKIAYNVIVNAVAKVLSTVLALVAIGFITRYLGAEGFGNYATALAFFSLFAAIADLGLYTVTAREISRKDAPEEKIMGNVFGLRIVTALVMLTIVPLIVYFLPYPTEVKMAILLSGVAFVLSSSYIVLNGIFQKNLAMDRVAIVELIGKGIQVGVIILAIQNDWGFLAIMSSLVVYMLFNFIFVFILSRKFIRFRPRFDLVFWKSFLKESLPMGIAVLITFLYFKFDTILLSLLKGSEDVGIYNGAYKIIENVTFFPAMIVGLVLPLLSRNIFENREKFEILANKTLKVFLLLIVPLIIGGFLLAKEIVLIIGGEEFLSSAIVLQILVFALGLIFLGHLFNTILVVGNLQRKLMMALGFCAVFNIGANILVIPHFSYIGAAATSVATEFLVVLLTAFLVKKWLNYTPTVYGGGRILLSGLIMGMFIYFTQNIWSFFIVFPLAVVVYALAVMLTKAVNRDELVTLLFRREA